MNILVISNRNSFRVLFHKTASVYFTRKNTNILALEMASPGNRHCASCIGTVPVVSEVAHVRSVYGLQIL